MDGDHHFALSRFMLEHHDDAVVVLDVAGSVIAANKTAAVAELDISALFEAPERDVRIDAFIEELETSGHAFTLVAASNGSVFRLEGTAVGELRIVLGRRLSKPEERETALGTVAATLIHDFNNLLMPIMLLSGRLVRDLDEGSDHAMMAFDIHASASVAAAMARDVLALSKPRMPALERVDVNNLILELERLTRRLAGPNIEVLLCLDESAPLETRVDRKRLEHAVLSLVVAARDAMPDGGHLAIATALVDHEGARRISLSFTDTSDGANATRPPPSGANAFPIDVRTERGKGTSSTIHLDLAPPSSTALTPNSSTRMLEGRGVDANTGNARVVMIAERDELVRRAIKRVLESQGWIVVSAESQDEALQAAATQPLSVALLDAAIVRKDPTTFLHQLRALAPQMRFVLLASHAVADTASPIVVLPKPFGDRELVEAIAKALR